VVNVKIGTVASQFPEKEYINGIFVAVLAYSMGTELLYNAYSFKNDHSLGAVDTNIQ
jgi:hypothetical protein